jgi:hypothetical protein
VAVWEDRKIAAPMWRTRFVKGDATMPLEHNDTMATGPAGANAPLTEADAAARLGLKVATLRAWRHQRKGPAFVRLGRAIRYLPHDVDAFLHANRHGASPHGNI